MKKHFYSHLITVETVHLELSNLEMSDEERRHLADLAEANLHHTILDAVLSELDPEDKKEFLKRLHLDDHSEIWVFLAGKTKDFEKIVKEKGEELVKKLHKDIKYAKST